MRFALPPVAVVLAVAAVGCGSSTPTSSQTTPTPTPVTPGLARCGDGQVVKAEAGACIRQDEEAQGRRFNGAPFLSSAPSQGVDVSKWQGVPDFRLSGVRFVLIQTNDGSFANPLLAAQVAAARRAGIPFGFYTFTEAFSGDAQAAFALALGQRYHPPLGYWTDVEVNGAYQQACSYVERIRRAGVLIFGVYSSPGLYFAGRCAGYDWPARWSSGPAGALAGYPSSATRVRQWCGTCRLAGFSGEVDRDESLGLLALVKPPETPSQHRARVKRERTARLHRDYRDRRRLDRVLAREHCLHGYRGFSRHHQGQCTKWRVRHGRNSRDIKRLHRLGVR